MVKITFILCILLCYKNTLAQYTFRGKVFNEIRQKNMTWGHVKLGERPGSFRTKRNDPTEGIIDSSGFFSIMVNDSANVTLIVDCGLNGRDTKTVSYADTL